MKRMITQELIDELSSIIEQGGFEWVKSIKPYITKYDQRSIQIGADSVLFAIGEDDGFLSIDIANQEVMLANGLSSFVDSNEDYLFPFEDNAGKVLVVNEDADGLEAKDLMSGFTHSFNELDSTLKQIVEDAIADGWTDGVACSEAQWGVIKALLDKSLYINYTGYSMIKTITDGTLNYIFGVLGNVLGARLEFHFENNLLLAAFNEL